MMYHVNVNGRNSFNVRPGDDEGVITVVDSGTEDAIPPAPSPGEIDGLFVNVDEEYEAHLAGKADVTGLYAKIMWD